MRLLVLSSLLLQATTYDNPFTAYLAGAYEQALSLFLDAQVDKPDDPRLAYNAGNAAYKACKYDDAARAYAQAAAADDPTLAGKALYNLGNTAYQQQRLEDAIRHYENALTKLPDDEDVRANLAFVKKRLEEQQRQQEQQQQDQQDQKQQDQEKQAQSGQDQQQQQGGQEQAGAGQQQDRGPDGRQQASNEPEEGEQGQATASQQPQPSAQEKGDPAQAGKQDGAQRAQATAQGQEGQLSQEAAERYLRELPDGRKRQPHGRKLKPARGGQQQKDW